MPKLQYYNSTTQQLEDVVMSGDNVIIDDSGNYFTGTDVETSLQEVGAKLNNIISKVNELDTTIVYGFHVDSSESDPSTAVTYLEDAVGMTPAAMNYTTGVFNYGSWENAFFMPRPCMLYTNGTVAYYLDEDDYTKTSAGLSSDIANTNFDGNAMMEWGRDGHLIWYKIVPDTDPTSYSVYIANEKVDDNYEAWNFYNKDNNLIPHFYTPIYGGSLDSSDKLRSLSGQTLMNSKTAQNETTYAKNNSAYYNIEVWSDKMLMFLLLYLMGKSLNVQNVFGQGHSTGGSSASDFLTTGTLNDKGLFYGYSSTGNAVKVFGMENQWGEQWRRTAGLMLNTDGHYYVKMTEGTVDGTTVSSYPFSDVTGLIDCGADCSENGYVTKFKTTNNNILPSNVGGGSTTYYCDYYYRNVSSVRFARLGGYCYGGASCGFCVYLYNAASSTNWNIDASSIYHNGIYFPYLLVKINLAKIR